MVGGAVLCARGGASTIQFIPWWANSDLGRGWVPELLAMAGPKDSDPQMSSAARLASTGSAREPSGRDAQHWLVGVTKKPDKQNTLRTCVSGSDRPDQAVQHTSPQAAASCTMTLALYYLLLTSIYRTTYLCLWLPKHEPCQFQWRSNVNSSAREVLA